ncbi:hypothetical protein [Sphingomonas mucosissima]|uniref:Uncharacterized protein n=1 Tax=Sphingomonas mucosissima TaxID=370959 RepID=A0A245ZDY6_9SPHN|nr:hypothetical protein [Sphingomonas mucosissima]OWK27962.1 hypothetical protein SPMU_32070 [Sphingomonas mucosissima]
MAHEGDNAEQSKKVEEDAPDVDLQHQPSSGHGLSSDLQPGGTLPGGGPGASIGSIGTGGGSTGGAGTGNVPSQGR